LLSGRTACQQGQSQHGQRRNAQNAAAIHRPLQDSLHAQPARDVIFGRCITHSMPTKANAFFLAKEAARQIKTCGSSTLYDGHTPSNGDRWYRDIRPNQKPDASCFEKEFATTWVDGRVCSGVSMRTIAALVACACVLGGTNRAAADQLTSFNVGNWSGGAYSDATGSKTFSYCAGSASYNSGITVVFFVDNNFQWGIGFFNSAWNLTSGSSYPIGFAVDSSSTVLGTATAITTNEVLLPLSPTVALFTAFMHGENLKVNASAGSFQFKLTDTVELLPDLLKCAEAYSGKAPASSNPFAN